MRYVVVLILMLAALAALVAWQPKWLPKWAYRSLAILLSMVTVASAVAALIPVIDPNSQIPVLVVYLSAVSIALVIAACIIVPAVIERSGQLRVVAGEYFKILCLNEKISAADLRTRAQENLHIKIGDSVCRRVIEILEAEGTVEILETPTKR